MQQKQNVVHHYFKPAVFFLSIIIICSLIIIFMPFKSPAVEAFNPSAQSGNDLLTPGEKPEPTTRLLTVFSLPQKEIMLNAQYAYLAHIGGENEVLLERLSGTKISPASITKAMTCIVAIENAKSLDATGKMTQAMYDYVERENLSDAKLMPGDDMKLKDLLYGLMFPSGADAAFVIANIIAGSEEDFVKMMNEKAAQLGLSDTQFKNPHGLDADGHYSTAADLAKMLAYCIKNETFKTVVSAKNYTTAPTKKYPNGISYTNGSLVSATATALTNGEIIGGKTGFTDAAGDCYAAAAEIDGELFIAVCCKAPHEKTNKAITDVVTLFSAIEKTTVTIQGS
jgi:D-alanyl-D-alanine carboxypeptidase (penicillin-binding protein 5/6)